jgi:hypothetical protein
MEAVSLMRAVDRFRPTGPPAESPASDIRRHRAALARLREVMAVSEYPLDRGVSRGAARPQRQRPPWRRGTWTPEEAALALYSHRDELRSELGRISAGRDIPAIALDEIVDDAACAVVMKPRPIRDEQHLT